MKSSTALKWGARGLLLLFVLTGAVWFLQIDFAKKISTDVLDLIPVDEQVPELAMVRSLASEQQSRVALFALSFAESVSADEKEEAGAAFGASLAASPLLAEVVPMSSQGEARENLGRYAYEHRFELLLPDWLAARETEYREAGQDEKWPLWLAEKTAADLETFLAQPEALPFQDLIPSDPLLLIPSLAQAAEGFDENSGGDESHQLIWARVAESPFREAGQTPLFAAVEEALAAARLVVPKTEMQWTAVSRFAAESRDRIEKEMSGLNALTLIAVLAVAALAVHRLWKVLHLLPVILGALLGAWMVTTMLFPQVHVLVFVIGSLLGGIAVDYGFYLYLQPTSGAETYPQRVRRLSKPLLTSALTTVLGFSLLLFSDLPLIRQLGVFVSAGLLSALVVALLWFGQISKPQLDARRLMHWRPTRITPGWQWSARGVLLGVAVLALLGLSRLDWRDDIRDLDVPALDLKANDQAVRELFGDVDDRAIYFSRGDSLAEARASLGRFLAWHRQEFPGMLVASIGLTIPTQSGWASLPEEVEALAGFVPALREALDRHGFNADSFKSFELAWRRFQGAPHSGSYEELVRGVLDQLSGPMAMLYHVGPEGKTWFASLAEGHAGIKPPPETSTISAGQLESLNDLFSRYRESALRLSGLGLGLVGLSVFVIYGWRRGLRIFAVPVGSCLFAFGTLGLLGASLNLFHLLGAFLGVCLSHDYAIFSAEHTAKGEAPPVSIRLSGLTTATSFGLLSLSSIPVVAALGATVSLIVISALLIVELMPLTRR